jgi:hypothetical protein
MTVGSESDGRWSQLSVKGFVKSDEAINFQTGYEFSIFSLLFTPLVATFPFTYCVFCQAVPVFAAN